MMEKTNPSLQWFPASDRCNPWGSCYRAIQLQTKKTMSKFISLELAFYGVKKQQEGTEITLRESFRELWAITPRYSDKCLTAEYHCKENFNPWHRLVPRADQLWLCQWGVPYVALAILHKLSMLALPRQVQALKTPLYVTVNPDMLCSGVVFILESNTSSFKLYSRMTLKTK